MILADVDLARRIDGFEARGSKAIGEAAMRHNPNVRPFVKPLGRGIAVYSGPNSPANKIIGVGFDDELQATMLDEIERRYFERGSFVQAEVATLASPAVHALLTARGYLLQGFEDVLGRLLVGRRGACASASEETGYQHHLGYGVPGRPLYGRFG